MARRPFFSGNYGSSLGSTAQAADIIARAGQQRGQALANMGAQIGGMIQQYGLNKEKREKAEAAFRGTIGRMSATPEGAARLLMMQNDPVIGKDLKAIQEGQGKMKNFDNVNAFMAGDREQETLRMARENAILKLELQKLNKRFTEETIDSKISQVKDVAKITGTEAKQAPDKGRAAIDSTIASTKLTNQKIEQGKSIFPLQQEYLESRIDATKTDTSPPTAPNPPNLKELQTDLERIGKIETNIVDDDGKKISVQNLFVREPNGGLVVNEDYTSDLDVLSKNNAEIYINKSRDVLEAQQAQPVRLTGVYNNPQDLSGTPRVGDEIQLPDEKTAIVIEIRPNGQVVYEYETNLADSNFIREQQNLKKEEDEERRKEEVKKLNQERSRLQEPAMNKMLLEPGGFGEFPFMP